MCEFWCLFLFTVTWQENVCYHRDFSAVASKIRFLEILHSFYFNFIFRQETTRNTCVTSPFAFRVTLLTPIHKITTRFVGLNVGFVSPCVIVHSNESTKPDAAVSQVYCLSFKYSSTCFGHPHAHHQELNNCSSSHWFTVGTWWQLLSSWWWA